MIVWNRANIAHVVCAFLGFFTALVLPARLIATPLDRLEIVDRFGNSIRPYELEIRCPGRNERAVVSDSHLAPSLRSLRKCDLTVVATGFRIRTVTVTPASRRTIALDVAPTGDPDAGGEPPLALRFAGVSERLYRGAEVQVRLLFRYGDEVYTAPLAGIGEATLLQGVPSGCYLVFLQTPDTALYISGLTVTNSQRDFKLVAPSVRKAP